MDCTEDGVILERLIPILHEGRVLVIRLVDDGLGAEVEFPLVVLARLMRT